MDSLLSRQLSHITASDVSINKKRVAAGKAVREAVNRLDAEGRSAEEISELVGLRVSRVQALLNK